MKMFNTNKTIGQDEIEMLKEEAGDFSESGYLLTEEYLKRLARSVFIAAKLPVGDDYVVIIGHGYEKSNQEAVYTLFFNNLVY